jgi:CRISPR-associated protein Cmr3
MTTIGLGLEALDVLFFRDGRPFAAAARAATGRPTPQTLAGALRTALLEKYGCAFDKLQGATDFPAAVAREFPDRAWLGRVAFRGPWLAREPKPSEAPEVLVSMPASLHEDKEDKNASLKPLRPLAADALPGWRPDEDTGPRPLVLKGRERTEPAPGFLDPKGLAAFLRGGEVLPGHVVPEADLFAFDYRTGIGVHPDLLAAEESQIYGISFLALQRHVGLYAEAVLPDDAPADAIADIPALSLGGEGRRARLFEVPRFGWQESPPPAGQKTLLLLTTPCLFAGRWRPKDLNNLAAAAVPQPLAVSGWDMARHRPRPTRFAAPAGSVYFLDGPAEGLPATLAESDEDARLGWGCYLKGAWKDA